MVIAIRPAPENMEEQVDLGRRDITEHGLRET
jgi:hypothetical protein